MGDDVFRHKPKYPNMTLKFAVPIPPSVNHMYYNTRFGGKHLTKQAEQYIATSRAIINQCIEDQHWIVQDDNPWYYVDMVFYMPDRRIRDSHNCLKLLLDVMQGIIFKNDYYALPRIQSVEYDKQNPRVEIIVHVQTKSEREKAIYVISKENLASA